MLHTDEENAERAKRGERKPLVRANLVAVSKHLRGDVASSLTA